jgi:predicted Ser/Thr protein kinase
MSEPDDIAQLSLDAWIDQVADRFDAAWKESNSPPRLAEFIAEATGDARRTLLKELIAIDQEYRDRHGMPKPWQAYAEEFPELRDQPATDSAVSQSTMPLRPAAERAGRKPAAEHPLRPVVDQSAVHDIPAAIGKYQVLERLGGGGQATAYLAFDPDLSQNVVLKLCHDEPGASEIEALKQEGRVLSCMRHAGLVRVLHYDVHQGRPYLVMEHVQGRNLAQWAADNHPTPMVAARLVSDIARAISAAHHQGIVHRDLKPANILIDSDGDPRVIDFGLAWHRHGWNGSDETDSTIAGTLAYMSPEQARAENDRIGAPTDVFGLGAILFFLLTGQAPFLQKGEHNLQQVLARARKCSFDAGLLQQKHIPPRLAAIVLKALAAEPAERYASAADLGNALSAFAESRSIRRRAMLAVSLCLPAAVMLGFGWLSRRVKPTFAAPVLDLQRFENGELLPGMPGQLVSGRDQVQLRWRLPAGYVGDLYALAPSHEFVRLEHAAGSEAGEFVAPGPGSAFPIEGSAGTELLLLVVQKTGSSRPDISWKPSNSWPAMPPGNVWRLLPPAQIVVLERTKAVGVAVRVNDPTEMIRTRLLELAKALNGRCEHFEALVIPRSADPEASDE